MKSSTDNDKRKGHEGKKKEPGKVYVVLLHPVLFDNSEDLLLNNIILFFF